MAANREGLRAFVENHDRLFTVLGALIVFIGFYTQEIVKEQSQFLASSLTEGRRSYGLATALQDIRLTVHEISKDQARVDIANLQSVQSDRNILLLRGGVQASLRQLELHKDLFLISQVQLGTYPVRPDGLVSQQNALEQQLLAVSAKASSLQRLEPALPSQVSSLATQYQVSTVNSLWREFAADVSRFTQGEADFNQALSAEGDRQLAGQEHKEKTAKIFAYALYIVGWLMGLTGKLLKLPVLGGGSA